MNRPIWPGWWRGRVTKSNIIGLVGGYPIPEVNRLMQAFMAGATSVNPEAKFAIAFIDGWYDPEKSQRGGGCPDR